HDLVAIARGPRGPALRLRWRRRAARQTRRDPRGRSVGRQGAAAADGRAGIRHRRHAGTNSRRIVRLTKSLTTKLTKARRHEEAAVRSTAAQLTAFVPS